MKIHFHGAAQTVTGSQHLLEINGKRLLLECGMFQGRRAETYERNRRLPYSASNIDAVVLSHAHVDHCGNLPHLVLNGYSGPIFATPATAEIAHLMMCDSGKIHEADAAYLNKKLAKQGKPLVEPLYTIEDAQAVRQYFQPIEYDTPFEPIPGVVARFVEAGHILGSAAIVLDIDEGGRKFRLWFSGDIGRFKKPLLRDPVLPENADYLLMECTYGDKAHRDPEQAYAEVVGVVNETAKRSGKLIIPAFAVGRTQELVYWLQEMEAHGDIPKLPVFVDSPLAVEVTKVFRNHTALFDLEAHAFMSNQRRQAILGFDHLTYVSDVEDSKALNARKDPMIIISASGMMESGRVLHHLKHNIENPASTVMICSWQAPYTLGRRLADQEKNIKIFGEMFYRRCKVVTVGGFSAHAGQNLLTEYAQHTQERVKKVFLVHGEARGANPLMERLQGLGFNEVYYPELHSTHEIE